MNDKAYSVPIGPKYPQKQQLNAQKCISFLSKQLFAAMQFLETYTVLDNVHSATSLGTAVQLPVNANV